jgi:uncharacterized repeat protein (TIGR01451 family)
MTFLAYGGKKGRKRGKSRLPSKAYAVCRGLYVDFGQVPIGTTVTQHLTLTNAKGSTDALTINSIEFTFNQGGAFNKSHPNLPAVLDAGVSLDVVLTFTPNDFSFAMADLLITNTSDNAPSLALSMLGSGEFAATPGDLNGDDVVDRTDQKVLHSSLGRCNGEPGFISDTDYNGSGCTDLDDYRIWVGFYRDSNPPAESCWYCTPSGRSLFFSPSASMNLDLGSPGFDMALDTARQRLYVSVPDLNQVAIVSLATWTVLDRVVVGSSPHGIDLSPDGNALYIALNQGGAVARLDLNTLAVSEVEVAAWPNMGSAYVYDVSAATSNGVFASGNPGISGSARIIKIDTANGNLVTRVASWRIIRFAPVLVASPDQQSLYIGEGDSVYKLDLTQPDAPLVLENISVSGTHHLAINPGGSRLFLASGQVLRTDTLTQAGLIGAGISAVSSDGTKAYVAYGIPNHIDVYDTSTFLKSDMIVTACAIADVERIIELQLNQEWVLLGQQTVCRVERGTSSPHADLSITMLASADPVDVNSQLLYDLSVTNTGPASANNVQVQDTLPPGVSFVSATGSGWSCSNLSRIVTCTRTSLGAGTAPVITLEVTAPLAGGDISNTASVSSNALDSNPSNNTATETTAIVPIATSTNLDLGSPGFDMALDTARQRLYVSVPDLNQVAIVSLATWTVLDRVVVGSSPHGIDLSPDGNALYIALNQGGAVARLDLNTLAVSEVEVAAEIGSANVSDVSAATSDAVFASANTSSFAYIIKIDTANGNLVTRVASNRIIRWNPVLVASPDQQSLYIGEGASPNSVYKLDLTQPDAPLVLDDIHGSVSGTDHLAVNPDGSRLFLASGQVLRTDTLTQAGLIESGVSTVSSDGTKVYVGYVDIPNRIDVYDTSTFLKSDMIVTACAIAGIGRIIELQLNQEWIQLSGQTLCRVTRP